MLFHRLVTAVILAIGGLSASAQAELPTELREKIDKIATGVLTKSGVPSASIAVIKDGRLVYLKAYGDARIEPKTPAKPEMRYSIGSISKQFTAAAVLLLQEQGKLSLDDKVAKYLPALSRADEVTLRQILSHTSGYQDYWPQDYVMPMMLEPVAAEKILEKWAKKPLDFDPGTKWQYSNTNYVIAGIIVEKVAGMPLVRFLHEKIFTPLSMKSVFDSDQEKPAETDPAGYMRYGLGPLRLAPATGKGWLFAAGELAMTAEDLAKWDISIIDQKLMKPQSYRELGTQVSLRNGICTRYGLGVDVNYRSGQRTLSHGGEVSGFCAENVIYPDARAAVVVLTNQDATESAGEIAHSVGPLLFAKEKEDPAAAEKLKQARKIFHDLQRGAIDRTLLTENANSYFSEQALKDFASGLETLGPPREFVQVYQDQRGGMTQRVYRIAVGGKNLRAWTYELPDGKLEQFQLVAQD